MVAAARPTCTRVLRSQGVAWRFGMCWLSFIYKEPIPKAGNDRSYGTHLIGLMSCGDPAANAFLHARDECALESSHDSLCRLLAFP